LHGPAGVNSNDMLHGADLEEGSGVAESPTGLGNSSRLDGGDDGTVRSAPHGMSRRQRAIPGSQVGFSDRVTMIARRSPKSPQITSYAATERVGSAVGDREGRQAWCVRADRPQAPGIAHIERAMEGAIHRRGTRLGMPEATG